MTALGAFDTLLLAVDPVPWARAQMAFTLASHIILVPLGVSWAFMTLVANHRAIKKGDAEVHTVEHLLSAARGIGVDNLEVELDGIEMPGLDGSSKKFLDLLKEAGVIEQDAPREEIVITEPIGVSNAGGASIVALPNDRCERLLRDQVRQNFERIPLAHPAASRAEL